MKFIMPPTDSYYKFIAISGLLLLVYSFYSISNNDDRIYRLGEKYFDLTIQNDSLRIEISSIGEIQNNLKSNYSEKTFQIIGLYVEEKISKQEYESRMNNHFGEMGKILETNFKNLKSHEIYLNKMSAKAKKIKEEIEYWKSKEIYWMILLCCGLLVLTFGFGRWYKVVQLKLDEIQELEIDIRKLELKKLQNEINVSTKEGEEINQKGVQDETQ